MKAVWAIVRRPPARDKTRVKADTLAKSARQSARQAENPSLVPVLQCAMLCLVHGLGILGPREKMTGNSAEALSRSFDQPLFDEDITAIAKLTTFDARTLKETTGTSSHVRDTPSAPC
ncbi:Histidyl-tRNA synthetase [Hordeum vulgare]|nr:Histidyl-tRNA synthetase [Hordeum vulgare]